MQRLKLWTIGGIFALFSLFSSTASALAVCDWMRTTSQLITRTTPSFSGSTLGTLPQNSYGLIDSGPITADGYLWWYIRWSAQLQGWSTERNTSGSENYMASVPTSPLIYTNYVAFDWCVNPWANSAVVVQATPARVGSYSMKTVTSANWARLYLKTNGISSTGYNSLRFSVRSESTNGQILYVSLYNTSGAPFHYVLVSDYAPGGTLSPNTWYDVRIPLSGSTELNVPSNQTIGGFVVESAQPTTFYVDDAALDTVSGTTKPSSTITGVTVTCSPTSIQVNQTSQCSRTVSGTGSYSSVVTWSANTGGINSSGLFTAPANAGTALVTATSVQDSSKSGTANVTISGAQMSQANNLVFIDALQTGWTSSPWQNTTADFASSGAHGGNRGITVTTTDQYGRLLIVAANGYKFNTSNYQSLSFWANIGEYQNEQMYVGLLDVNGSVIQYQLVDPFSQEGVLSAYQWGHVEVPLTNLNAASRDVYGVEIQLSNPGSASFDAIRFDPTGGACYAE